MRRSQTLRYEKGVGEECFREIESYVVRTSGTKGLGKFKKLNGDKKIMCSWRCQTNCNYTMKALEGEYIFK
jgi:hypothetical protein